MSRAIIERLLLLAGLLLCNGSAAADWFSGNAGVVSDYLFRGLDQTNGPALQGGLDYVQHSGLYAGGWASNNRSAGGGELDLYGGYSRPLALFDLVAATLDAGAVAYVYSGERQAALGGGSQDFAELYAGIGAGPATFKFSYAPDYAGRGAPGWYAQGAVAYPLGGGFKLQAALGYGGGAGLERQTALLTADGTGQSYLDYSLRLSKVFKYEISAWVEMAGTDLRLAQTAQGGREQPKFLAGLRKDFDF